jgi:TorA maturation chaperone TorD/DNA-binding transcriptional regulator YdaS (Cro superfamily)
VAVIGETYGGVGALRAVNMRDDGLKRAIDAAGGITALARGLGIAQPSVSSWSRVPAERVAAIETLTGVERSQLRPDLFASLGRADNDADNDKGLSGMTASELDETAVARADEYLLLAALLRLPVTEGLLGQLQAVTGDATPLGLAHIALAEAAARTNCKSAGREFFNLFIGVGRGELLPYGSFYLTGFLNDRPLARVREDLTKLGIERSAANHDPEDHITTLFEVMAGLARGDIEAPVGTQAAFFQRHLEPWAARFFADLAVAPSAEFYKAVAAVGLAFIEIETEAFTLPDPSDATH